MEGNCLHIFFFIDNGMALGFKYQVKESQATFYVVFQEIIFSQRISSVMFITKHITIFSFYIMKAA